VHAGGEGDLGLLACGAEAIVEGAQDGVVAPDGGDGSHVEDGPDGSSSAPDPSGSPEGSAVTVHGSHAHERGDLLSVELAELGEVGHQDPRGLGPDARDGPDPLVEFAVDRTAADLIVQVAVGTADGFAKLAAYGRLNGGIPAVKSIQNLPEVQSDPYRKVFVSAIQAGGKLPFSPYATLINEFSTVYARAFHDILLNNAPIKKTLDDVAEEMNRIVESKK
jgi:hypothetical protein